MSITLNLAPRKASGQLSRTAVKVATTALAVGGLGVAVLLVAFVRTFGFEYFHGDHAALAGLGRLLLGN
ncbi:hypothetical protein [Reyranella sp.]|uniref:hypothetical protein n=1 Tax=Reyranella sp. TaxID=1929291 RepID=UPI003D14A30F